VINDDQFIARSEIIWEKGTNRSAFWRGEVDKYGWVDVGSSFLPSEITAAFLFAQLENLNEIQKRRKEIWHFYYYSLKPLSDAGKVRLPFIPSYATNNAHLFYIICGDYEERISLIDFLKKKEIHTVFHYLSLHKSQFYIGQYHGENLPNADMYSDCLVRLPFYYELEKKDQSKIIKAIHQFYDNLKTKL